MKTWPPRKEPWSDRFCFVPPLDHHPQKGRSTFGLSDAGSGVREFVIDWLEAKSGHEVIHENNIEKRTDSRVVFGGGNYFDMAGDARCAERPEFAGVTDAESTATALAFVLGTSCGGTRDWPRIAESTTPLHTFPMVPKIFSVICIILLSTNAFAWGPHGEITQAALDAMGSDDPLVRHLGPDARRLTQYVWMADLRQTLLVRVDEVFYADDYLLFPASTRHYQHICPEVKQTYSPYFRRALQAMRTESTRNASRWIGSLLHFTTDTGSPPHAAEILGPVHTKMENWLDAKLIQIPGYNPQLLGEDDVSAEAGFCRRMDGLITFSKERAQRCRADIDADRRVAVEPVVLESALETARVTADLLHTLGVLAAQASEGATLTGKVIAPKIEHATMSRLASKVVLLGTSYSTLTDVDGTFTFRHLPPGEYRLVVVAPGCFSEAKPVSLAAAATVSLEPVDLSQSADGNLLRNGSFSMRWVSAEAFDHWLMRSPPGKLAAMSSVRDWDGEWIPLQAGVTYHLMVRWRAPGADANGPQVFLRTKAKPDGGSLTSDSASVIPGQNEVVVTGSPEAGWAQVCLRTSQSPDVVVEVIELRVVMNQTERVRNDTSRP